LAAKALGVRDYRIGDAIPPYRSNVWNPRDDDGDAFRLAVDLRLTVLESSVRARDGMAFNVWPQEASDRYDATRLAILRAAAYEGRLQWEPEQLARAKAANSAPLEFNKIKR